MVVHRPALTLRILILAVSFVIKTLKTPLKEEAHPWASLSCVDCHGGNKDAFTQEEAHVPRPAMVTTSYRHLATEQMNALDSDYLRFVNPGDLRVAEISCGSKTHKVLSA